MTKSAFKLSLVLSTLTVLPALGAEQFQCPSSSNPNNPAKLEQISVDAVNSVAKKQGISGPAWIAMTIDNALQQQTAARRQ
jgi:hypothetical protein